MRSVPALVALFTAAVAQAQDGLPNARSDGGSAWVWLIVAAVVVLAVVAFRGGFYGNDRRMQPPSGPTMPPPTI